jgi:hypothetical protein
MGRGVRPIERPRIGRKRQAVGGAGLAHLALQLTARQTVQGGLRRIRRVAACARPKASQRIGLAVVEARGRRVMQGGRDTHQRAPPGRRAVDPVTQGDQQAAAAYGRDASGLGGHRPGLRLAAVGRCASHAAAHRVHPIEHALVRMEKRRLAQRVGLLCEAMPNHERRGIVTRARACAANMHPPCPRRLSLPISLTA